MILSRGTPAKHTDTRIRPDSLSRYMPARLMSASGNGRDYYNARHKREGHWTVIDGQPIWLPKYP